MEEDREDTPIYCEVCGGTLTWYTLGYDKFTGKEIKGLGCVVKPLSGMMSYPDRTIYHTVMYRDIGDAWIQVEKHGVPY